MILRRLTEHVKAQNWFAVALDFVIVVTGVFIGLQVNNWNEARQQRLREARYLERLDAEMDVIRERLKGGAKAFEKSVRNIDMLLDIRRRYDENPEGALPSDDILAAAASDVSTGRVPAGSPAAFKEMVASGALETLTRDELRHALFAYDEFSGVTRDAWRTLRDEHRDAANLIGSLVDADAPDDLSDLTGAGVRDLLVAGFDRPEYLENPDVMAALGVLLSTQINQLALVQSQLELAENIEALIAEERTK